MGIDAKRFVTPPDPELVCQVCHDVLDATPLQTPCEHCFCEPCIRASLANLPACPTCRALTTPDQLRPMFRMMRNILANLQVRCENQEHGCEASVRLQDLREHEVQCEFASVHCPFPGCPFSRPPTLSSRASTPDLLDQQQATSSENTSNPTSVKVSTTAPLQPASVLLRHALATHVQTCDYRQVACELGCGAWVPHAQKAIHEQACTMRCSLCPKGCGVRVPLPRLEEHYARDCLAVEVPCSIEGCSHKLARGDTEGWEKHHKDPSALCCHVQSLSLSLHKLTRQLESTQTQVTVNSENIEHQREWLHRLDESSRTVTWCVTGFATKRASALALWGTSASVGNSSGRGSSERLFSSAGGNHGDHNTSTGSLSPSVSGGGGSSHSPRHGHHHHHGHHQTPSPTHHRLSRHAHAGDGGGKLLSPELCFQSHTNPRQRYWFRICVHMAGKGNGIGLFFVPRRGPAPEVQDWPISKSITMRVVNRHRPGQDRERVCSGDLFLSFCQDHAPPSADNLECRGYRDVLSAEDVASGEFVKDDVLMVQVVLGE